MIYLNNTVDFTADFIQKSDVDNLQDEIRYEIEQRQEGITALAEFFADLDPSDEYTPEYLASMASDLDQLKEELKELNDHEAFEYSDVMGYNGDLLIHHTAFDGYVTDHLNSNGDVPDWIKPYIDIDQYVEDQKADYAEVGNYYVAA